MSPPDLAPKWWVTPVITSSIALAMIPLGLILVMLAGYLASHGWNEGLALAMVAIVGIFGAYMPYAGVAMFVLLLLLWVWVFFLQRQRQVDKRSQRNVA
jgi:lysylphosphatidylglycerol synthetase-like protein (DUF2156 family)